jgi:hypothetical protein
VPVPVPVPLRLQPSSSGNPTCTQRTNGSGNGAKKAVRSSGKTSDPEIELLTQALEKYFDGKLGRPDRELVAQTLAAAKGASAHDIFIYLRHLRTHGQAPGEANGPRGWGWFPKVVAQGFSGVEAAGRKGS